MKYKDRYQCARHPGYSIGRVYTSDMRKIASLQQHYKFLFPDLISHNPVKFLTQLMRQENCLFYAVKNGKIVEGFGYLMLVDPTKIAEIDCFRKKLPFSIKKYRAFFETQLEFCFEELELRKLYGRVPAALPGLVDLIRKMGFTIEGIMRKDMIFDEKPQDMVLLGMLREEF